jgi:hypothetical protein
MTLHFRTAQNALDHLREKDTKHTIIETFPTAETLSAVRASAATHRGSY